MWSELRSAKHVAEYSWGKMSSGTQKHGRPFIKSNVLWNAKYLAKLWDEINFGATKIWRNVLGITRAPERSQNKNDIGSERKVRKSRNANRVMSHFLNVFSNIALDSYYSRFPSMMWNSETQLHFLERKERQLKLFSIFKREKSFVDFQLSYRIDFQLLPKFSLLWILRRQSYEKSFFLKTNWPGEKKSEWLQFPKKVTRKNETPIVEVKASQEKIKMFFISYLTEIKF